MSTNWSTWSIAATHDEPAASAAFSSANAFAARLTFGGTKTSFGSLARVSGSASPYDKTKHVHHLHKVLDLDPGSPFNPTLQLDEAGIQTNATSDGFGIDFISSRADAHIGSSNFVLPDYPFPPGIIELLGMAFSATDINSSADFSHVFGSSQSFVTGGASFGSLSIGGSLIGRTLKFSGDAAPNTVLYSSATVTVTLDKQIVTDLISIGPTPAVTPFSITTEAVDISLHNASFRGTRVSGDIIIGQASAGTSQLYVPGHPAPS